MTQHPDKESTLVLLTGWQAHHAAVTKLMEGMEASPIGLDFNSGMFLTVWNLFDAYTSTLSAEIGDFGEWLEWYQTEACMGKRPLSAGYYDKTRKIKTLAQLYGLIEKSRKREDV